MFAPIFQVCAAYAPLTAIIGTTPVRMYPAGEAIRIANGASPLPYVVWQSIGGSPENYVNQRPDIDYYDLQIDAYAPTLDEAREVAGHVRDAIEDGAHITRWGGESRDPTTRNYRVSFDVQWFVTR